VLTAEQIDAYRTDGYVSLGSVLDADEIAGLLEAEERFRPKSVPELGANRTLLVRTQLCHRSEAVRAFATRGRQIEAVVDLLGPNVCLTHQQFVTKLPDDVDTTSEISLHQDNGYGRLDPPTDVTVWVALHDADERNGCLVVIPGSHELGVLEHARAGVNPFLREVGVDPDGAIAVPMAAGEAIAFTGQTVHGSGPNLTDRARVGLFVRYCEPHVRMVTEDNRKVLDDPNSWMVAGEA
jgi:ectoine hydroxylase-related dioxygenase (phytanoyl-CoA dioxygenase family)